MQRKLAYTATPRPWRNFKINPPADYGTWPVTQSMSQTPEPFKGGPSSKVWGYGTPSDVGPNNTFPFPSDPQKTDNPSSPLPNTGPNLMYSREFKNIANGEKDKLVENIMMGNWDNLTSDEKLTIIYNQNKINNINTNNLLLGILIFLILIALKLYSS
jgi:hypothetical protein